MDTSNGHHSIGANAITVPDVTHNISSILLEQTGSSIIHDTAHIHLRDDMTQTIVT
jgi:hypothetical protein